VSWFEKYNREKGDSFQQVMLPGSERVFAEVSAGRTTIRFFQPLPVEYLQLLVK
jgi:hypothetical protein